MTDESTGQKSRIVALRRSDRRPVAVYDDATRVRCFVIYATMAARNCAATARLYADEARAFGEHAPDADTVRRWAADDDWPGQVDNLWRNTKGRTLQELQELASSNTLVGQKALHNILTGLDSRPIEERVLTLKAIEIAMKAREKLPELARVEPPEQERDTEGRTREELEAEAMAGIVRKKGA